MGWKMRNVKFRVWHKKENRWLDPWAEEDPILSLKDYGKGCEVFLYDRKSKEHSNINCQMDNVVIQQYTGIKDKNGVEIYEGDIVERRRERGLVDFNSKNYAQIPGWNLLLYQYVPYKKEGWIYQEKDDEGELSAIEYYYGCPPDKSWEVVGNIFEGVDR
jgi:uncharacterized phage protein (TIGR01671 family)